MLFFDIETEPLPLEVLKEKLPAFDASSIPDPGEFDPDAVKLGNLGPVKAEEKISEARRKHAQLVENLANDRIEAEKAYWDAIVDKAALSATTGKVLVIGFYDDEKDAVTALVVDDENSNEQSVLKTFWMIVGEAVKQSKRMAGVNIFDFDLPFLVRRSWILDVDVRQSKSSFDEIGRAFGTGGKPDGINGGDFARLWREDRETAKRYLINDLKQPAQWATRMNA